MRTENIAGKKVEIYDSIEELSINRFHKYNKNLLVDSGIGATGNDVTDHIGRAVNFINAEDKESAVKELNNLRLSIYLISNEINPKHLAFAPLVKSIDGEQMSDLSDSGMENTLSLLKEANKSVFEKIFDQVKKKLKPN